ncbi:NgoFVII family restriction endonuclease [Gammaproteobacteria bacterium]|nr:NgoFVII family restriction endonuclease [Gammaproteobacteria bacterium]
MYEKILINPVKEGFNELHVVSGYSSATFLKKHLEEIVKINANVKINIIIGMHQKRRDHSSYLISKKTYPEIVYGFYYQGKPEVHSKIYRWSNDQNESIAFSGSANYSQFGFFSNKQRNQMVEDNPNDVKNFYDSLLKDVIPIEDYLVQPDEIVKQQPIMGSLLPGKIDWVKPDDSVRISLLARNGELPSRSGLNWGQRPEHKRDPNQAYLSIKGDARKEGFLPEKKFSFTLITDDNVTMDCTVQQDGRKAISTTNDNSELGRYFRNRLGLPLGKRIYKDHLMKYGRTDFLLKKLNDETFYLDFSAQ